MRRSIGIILTALALMVGGGAQAHDAPLSPGHKHDTQIRAVQCSTVAGYRIFVIYKESDRPCYGKCSHTCLYTMWDESAGMRVGTPFSKCNIMGSDDPANALAVFWVQPRAGWTGTWGVTVHDGWGREDVTCESG